MLGPGMPSQRSRPSMWRQCPTLHPAGPPVAGGQRRCNDAQTPALSCRSFSPGLLGDLAGILGIQTQALQMRSRYVTPPSSRGWTESEKLAQLFRKWDSPPSGGAETYRRLELSKSLQSASREAHPEGRCGSVCWGRSKKTQRGSGRQDGERKRQDTHPTPRRASLTPGNAPLASYSGHSGWRTLHPRQPLPTYIPEPCPALRRCRGLQRPGLSLRLGDTGAGCSHEST